MKYKEWLNKWLESCIRPFVKESTYKRYETTCRLHLVAGLGDWEIAELSAYVLQSYIADLMKNYSTGTVNIAITVLQSSLKKAALLNLIKNDPGKLIVRPRHSEKQVECFSVAEQRRIEACVIGGKTQWLGILVCLYTGLRIGELMALTPGDIDLGAKQITVSKSCRDGWINGEYTKIIDTPKTESSKRVIPIPRALLPYVKRLKKACRGDFLICKGEKNISMRSYQRSFALILKNLGIAHRGFHSLRHTFATRALECGMDVKTLSEILGHKSVNITLNRYAHSLSEHKRAMMNKLGKLLQ